MLPLAPYYITIVNQPIDYPWHRMVCNMGRTCQGPCELLLPCHPSCRKVTHSLRPLLPVVRECVYVCVRVRVCVCVCVCVYVCLRALHIVCVCLYVCCAYICLLA